MCQDWRGAYVRLYGLGKYVLNNKKTDRSKTDPSLMLASPILPVRHQTSIVGASELNCRVRDGNGWTLTAIDTNYFNQFPG